MAKILKKVTIEGTEYAQLKDGKPLYVDDQTQQEIGIDGAASVDKITQLNGEAQRHRERAEKAEGDLKVFEGLDPTKAREALQTVENLDSGELLKANKVEEIRQAAIKSTEETYKGKVSAAEAAVKSLTDDKSRLTTALHGEKINNQFANSKYIAEKMAIPAPTAQKIFGDYFKVEEGDKIVAYDDKGTKIYSQEKPGELPSFDEALQIVVGSYAYKDSVLKGRQNSGGGGQGGEGGGGGGGRDDKSISRAAFDKLDPTSRMKHMREGGKVHDDAA